MDPAQFFTAIDPYCRLAPLHLAEVAKSFQETILSAGEMFISQGQPVQKFGIIRSGGAEVVVPDSNGLKLFCGNLKSGDIVFDLSILSGTESAVSVICLEQTSFLVQPIDVFVESLDMYPPLKSFFYQNVTMGVRWCYEINCGRHEGRFLIESGNDPDSSSLYKALLYIDKNFHKSVTLDMVAKETAMSRFHFSRQFKQYTGLSFKQYLNRKRVRMAKELICRHGYSVTEACFAVGFNDSSYFSKVFREVEGCSPRNYSSCPIVT
ncbi:helix-turn-helix domain-containing protein [Desulfobulbus elongatus]|uniref:helix-turn-helix domain-containing protein n=1 Tax=Desulfobulbus elongatus TaxID=53332 RepID=UPI000A054A1C|nr:helix-turn-helix domain-containing protein [Desulfobulbus elongatus]